MGFRSGVRFFIAVAAAAAIAGCTGSVVVEGGENGQGDQATPGWSPDNDAPQVGEGDVNDPDVEPQTFFCGDGFCGWNEACDTCPQDCGACPPGCGNGVCSANEDCTSCPIDCACATCGDGACDPSESCATCEADCGACPGCGNGVCTPNESCSSCPSDCGVCPCAHDKCSTGGPLVDNCDPCVAQICAVDSFCCQYSWDFLCVNEVGTICGTPCAPTCGDGLCDPSESCSSCSQDCGACPVCGDGWCNYNTEDCSTCAADCGACPACGNGACEAGETCSNCAGDCGACVCHDECQTGPALDPSCGACEAQICAVDPFCCSGVWDALCVNEVGTVCGTPCAPTCGDGWCDANAEDCSTCAADCGGCPFCGDGWCDFNTETCSSCSQDCGACPTCGDGVCDWNETCSICASDCAGCAVCGDGVCSPDEGCATCAGDCGACPACPGFDLGSFVPTSITGNTAGGQNALTSPCAFSSSPERTYSFTAPADGTYEINTFGSAYDTLIYAYDGACGGPVLGCNDDSNGMQSRIFLDLVAGQTIVIVVEGFASQQGAFSLNIL